MGAAPLAPVAFKVGSKVWVRCLRVIEGHTEGDSVWDGLWRPGGAYFQIGFACVMSHHYIEGLCTFLFKFWREIQIGVPANSYP